MTTSSSAFTSLGNDIDQCSERTGGSIAKSIPTSEEVLNDLLVLPQPSDSKSTGKRKKAINCKANEITDSAVLQELKDKEQAIADAKKMKEEKKLEREQKAREKQERKKLEREARTKEKKIEKEERKAAKVKAKAKDRKGKKKKKDKSNSPDPEGGVGLDTLFSTLDVADDDGQCHGCGVIFSQDNQEEFWMCCDKCNNWYCSSCHKYVNQKTIPDKYYCKKC